MPNVSFLKTFAAAWNSRDIDAIMMYMAADGVFISAAGERAEGGQRVRAAFSRLFAAFPDAHWESENHYVRGNRGVSEWVFSGTDAEDGTVVEKKGCAIFTFRDGKIVVKDTYMKGARNERPG